MILLKAFLLGGLLCVLGELLLSKTKLGPVKALSVCICLGVLCSAFGLMGPLAGFGEEGVTVTIFGAGAAIFDGVMGSVKDHGLIGLVRLTNFYFLRFAVLIICAVGVGLVCGYLSPKKAPEKTESAEALRGELL